MRRKMTIAFLALGTLVGYGSGIAQVFHHHHAECADWHPNAR
jgi:hypothetical protein